MPLINFNVDEDTIRDFDICAKFNLQNRSVYLRTLMLEAIKKAERKNPELFDKGEL